MFFSRNIFILIALVVCIAFGHERSTEPKQSYRKEKLLGISGYLSVNSYRHQGAADSFRIAPFWNQWNAVLHVNVQKRRPFGGNVVVIPTSFLYPNALGNGFYPGGVNNNNLFGSGGGGIGGPLFDEIKPNESPAVSSNPELTDKLKSGIRIKTPVNLTDDSNSSSITENDVERKTHKRDIKIEHYRKRAQKVENDYEVPAKVMEITESNITIPSEAKNKTEAITVVNATNTATSTTEKMFEIETTTSPDQQLINTTSDNNVEALIEPEIDYEFQPIYTFYYGGEPNENADTIFITTTDQPSTENVISSSSSSSPSLIHNSLDERNDLNDFKPSIQYEYKNYRYDVDEHFIPIVGEKQIF